MHGGRVDNHFGEITLGTPDRALNLDLPINGSLIFCKSSALEHGATEADYKLSANFAYWWLKAVNAGKSELNEDQACVHREVLHRPELRSSRSLESHNAAAYLPYVYFGIFDGHAGIGAAVAASNQLHHIIQEKLVDVLDHLLPPLEGCTSATVERVARRGIALWFPEKEISIESLIVGALESAFWDM
ncbi:unnamed protein product, partial [Timema podura]|nr:unnamed protein product [Timema podura]